MIQGERTLNFEKVLESRLKIVKDQSRLIGSDLKSVFNGAALIDWILENYQQGNTDRKAVEKQIQESLLDPMIPHQLIYTLQEGEPFKDSDMAYYRFIEDQFKEYKKDKGILNLYGHDTSTYQFFYEAPSQSVFDLIEELKSVVEEIYSSYLDESRTLVDYVKLEESEIFNSRLITVVAKLAFANISPLLENINQLKAFFLNIYNILTIHAVIARFRTKNKTDISLMDRADFYVYYRYNIGGHNYSLNDIAQGIFRRNCALGIDSTSTVLEFALKSKARNDRFSGYDSRRKFALNYLDPRVHFALNPGTVSGCALTYYDAEGLDIKLDIAAKEFCDKNTLLKIENEKRILEIPELCKFYMLDFAGNEEGLVYYIWSYKRDGEEKDNILQFLEEKNLQLKYTKVVWSLNKVNKLNPEI